MATQSANNQNDTNGQPAPNQGGHDTVVIDRGGGGGGAAGMLIALVVVVFLAIGAWYLFNANRTDALEADAVGDAAASVADSASQAADSISGAADRVDVPQVPAAPAPAPEPAPTTDQPQ
ncbi:MAG TPA: hypothetical protein VF122_07855 [Caulobacteraceae bacterium]